MKKSLSLVVAIAMVFSLLVPATAFAATSQERAAGEFLEELGVLKGNGEGDLYLDNNLNRQDMIVLLSRLMGVEEEVEEYGNTHGWEDVTDPYYDSYISWAKEEGLTIGVGDGSEFGYNDELSVHELLTFLIRALGYEGDWYEVPEQAVELGLVDEDADLEATATRGAMAVATQATLNTPVNGSNRTLGEELGLIEPEDLVVVSVKPLNLKQIEVVFSKEVDEDSATDASNYEFDTDGDADMDNAKLDLQEDGRTVLINLAKPAKQQEEVELSIEDVEDLDGEVIEDSSFVFEFLDTTLPVALEARVIGEDTIKVIFSEPVTVDNEEYSEAFEVDGGDFFINNNETKRVNNDTEINLVLYSVLEEGTITVSVNTNVEDYAGFSVMPTTFELDVVEDDEAPEVVGYKDVGRKGITLIFNEDIKLADYDKEDIYHTNDNNEAELVTDADIDGNELRLDFSNSHLPSGTAYIYIEKGAIKDYWNNENAKLVVEVKVTVDNEPPTVKKVSADDQNTLIVEFSEEIADAHRSNFELKDSDGDRVRISSASVDAKNAKKAIVKTSEDLDGDYEITIKEIEDLDGNEMEKVTIEFNVDDVTQPEFDKFKVYVFNSGEKDQKIRVEFDEKMATSGRYSITDLEKYELRDYTGTTYKEYDLSDVDNVRLTVTDGGEAVEIRVPADKAFTINAFEDVLVMTRVADAAGNVTTTISSGEMTIEDSDDIEFDYARLIDNDRVEVKFKSELSNFDGKEFLIVDEDGNELQEQARYRKDGSNSIVTIQLIKDLNDDATNVGTDVYLLVKAESKTENRNGQKVASGSDLKEYLEDKIAPALAELANEEDDVRIEGGQVVLTFTEAININSVSILSFEIEENDVIAVNQGVTANEVVLTVKDPSKLEKHLLVTQKLAIQDLAGNEVDDISTEITYVL